MIKVDNIKKLFFSSKENKYQKFLKDEQKLILRLEEMIKECAENCETSLCPSEAFFTRDEWNKVHYEYNGYKNEIIRYFRWCGFRVRKEDYHYVIYW
jgi:hypothetical protein